MNYLRLGVIPFIDHSLDEVFIITSRKNGKWIFPKGKPEKDIPNKRVAIKEAYEEAGLKGELMETEPFHFVDGDSENPTTFILFPMMVTEVLNNWPEDTERNRKAVSVKKAFKLLEGNQFKYSLLNYI